MFDIALLMVVVLYIFTVYQSLALDDDSEGEMVLWNLRSVNGS